MLKKSKIFLISSLTLLTVSTTVTASLLTSCSNNDNKENNMENININSYIDIINEIVKTNASQLANINDVDNVQIKIKQEINDAITNIGITCTDINIDLKSVENEQYMVIDPIKIFFSNDITCSSSDFAAKNNILISNNLISTKIISDDYISTIKNNILNNFNKDINSNNCNMAFLNKDTCLETIAQLSENKLDANSINDLQIINLSNENDNNLHLEIEFNFENRNIVIDVDTNIINPNSQLNLSYYNIDNDGNLVGLTDEGLKQTELYIPSTVKYINFPKGYAENNITNAKIINFSYARNFIGFVNNDTFLRNNSIESIIFDGCSNLVDLKQGAFSRLQNLSSISFEGCTSLLSIPKYAMDNCPKLSSINLKNCPKLNRIYNNAFENCINLKSIDLSNTDIAFTIDNNAFNGCINLSEFNLSNIISFSCGSNNFNLSSLNKVNVTSKLVYDILVNKVNDKNIIIFNSQKLGNKIEEEITNKQYEKSGFLKNAIERANDDSILYYACNNNGVMHTYGTIAHILKVLEINPNKEMHLIMSNKVYNSDWRTCNLDFFVNNPKYPNVHLYRTTLNEDSSGSLSAKYQYSISDIPEVDNGGIIDIIKKFHHENDKNVLYTADVTYNWFMCMWGSIAPIVSSYTKNNCVTNYFNLFKMIDEVNVINDGTMSTNVYSNLTYNLYKTSDPMFVYDIETDSFPNLVKLQKYVNNLSSEEFLNWLNISNMNFYYYMYSLISAGKSNDDGITKMKYYVASTDMVKDINNSSSSQFNDNVAMDEYFDPFNSQGFNFIDFFNSFEKETFENFLNVCGIVNVKNVIKMSEIIDTFNGKNNIIWIGDRIAKSSSSVNSNAQRLVDLLKYHMNLNSNSYVYFKGHPREYKPTLDSVSGEYSYWYVDRLLNSASSIIDADESIPSELKSDYKSRIKILDNQIPMEMFNGSGIIKNDSNLYSNKTTFMEYSTYSTYVLSAEEYDFSYINGIIISSSQNKDIEKRLGNGEQSLCFPNSKKRIL